MAQTVKKFAYNGGDLGSIPGLGRSPGEGNSYLLHPVFLPREFHEQRSLEGYSPWSHKQSDMAERLSHTYTHTHTACPSLCKQTSGKLSAVKLFWMCHFAFKSNWRQFFFKCVWNTGYIYLHTRLHFNLNLPLLPHLTKSLSHFELRAARDLYKGKNVCLDFQHSKNGSNWTVLQMHFFLFLAIFDIEVLWMGILVDTIEMFSLPVCSLCHCPSSGNSYHSQCVFHIL